MYKRQDLARQFGLRIVEPRPALVPLVLGGNEFGWTKLAGVSTEVLAWAEAAAGKKSDSIQFREKMLVTHRGLSGPAVLQASLYWQPGDRLVVNFRGLTAQMHPLDEMCIRDRDRWEALRPGSWTRWSQR